MSGKLTCTIYVSYGFIVAAVGFHTAGFLTNFWFTGTSDNKDAEIVKINMGLWGMETEYRGGNVTTKDSLLNIREEHYIMLAEAGANFILCFFVLWKHIHVCVGIIAFINMTLLLLSAFYSFVHLQDARDDLQEIFVEWPELFVSWSFYFVWVGIIVNLIATGLFLTALLLKGEIKATKSSKGLGPGPEIVGEHPSEDKIVRITSISGDNYGYRHDQDNKYAYYTDAGTSYPGTSIELVEPEQNNTHSEREIREPDIVNPDEIDVPSLEEVEPEGEPEAPYFIGKVNADDAENLEFGYGDFDPENPEIAEQHTGSLPDDDNIVESSRL